MELVRLDKNNEDHCSFVAQLYTDSFPPSERRSVVKMFELYADAESPYIINAVMEEDNIIGFITHWDLGDFIYAEHFAISSTIRNAGHGKKVIEAIKKAFTKPLVIEVELPYDDLSTRRLGFYTRMEFKLWEEIEYAQPSFVKGEEAVPMYLLTYGSINKEGLKKAMSKLFGYIYTSTMF